MPPNRYLFTRTSILGPLEYLKLWHGSKPHRRLISSACLYHWSPGAKNSLSLPILEEPQVVVVVFMVVGMVEEECKPVAEGFLALPMFPNPPPKGTPPPKPPTEVEVLGGVRFWAAALDDAPPNPVPNPIPPPNPWFVGGMAAGPRPPNRGVAAGPPPPKGLLVCR
jgi:hypothetical protein